jgi:hypothetical protein
MKSHPLTRAERNHNPGNIRRCGVRYRGERRPSCDPAFKEFESDEWGYRAMFVLLESYRRRYGIDTLRAIVTRWAPPIENDTENYILFVAKRAEVDPDAVLLPRDVRLRAIAEAMSRFERGHEPSPEQLDALDRGWKLFLSDY